MASFPGRSRSLAGSRKVLLAALLSLTGLPAAQAQPSASHGFAVELVAAEPFGGLPAGFAFLPDGRMVIAVRNGAVRLALPGSTASSLLYTIPGVTTNGERGLLGVAVDPEWPARPYLYFYYTHQDTVGHVGRLTASGDLSDPASSSLALADPYLVLADLPDESEIHNGGTLRFGPDGMLYLSLGDDELGCGAQDLTALQGAILRFDVSSLPATGTGPPPKADLVPPDNPYPGPNENERLIYAPGFRNPFRFTIDELTGDVFVGDVGQASWEEIDQIVRAGYAGANFGWPQREGPISNDPPDTCGLGNPFTDPIYPIPHPPQATSVVCGPRVRFVPESDVGLPAVYDGELFYADFFSGKIHRLLEDGGSWSPAPSVPGQPEPDAWASGLGFLADLQQGPDGAIYYANMVIFGSRAAVPDNGIYRIVRTAPTGAGMPESSARPGLSVLVEPNPATEHVTLRFELARREAVDVRIHDVAGRVVRVLSFLPREAGPGVVAWNGRDEGGRKVPTGTYFVAVRTASGVSGSSKISWVR